MLTAILEQFQGTQGVLCAEEVARHLARDLSAVEGMLDLLVGMGKLIRVGEGPGCAVCPARSSCMLLPLPRRSYALPSKGGE